MKQTCLGLGQSNKRTRRRAFLEEMDQVVLWSELVSLICPYLPKGRCQPPFAVEAMRRVQFMQRWCNLGNPALEEARHNMALFRDFVGLGGWDEHVLAETTILRFRHELEKHKLTPRILQNLNDLLRVKSLMLQAGSVVDATLIAAPSSTKNVQGASDPEIKQSKKGNQWYFGIKAHIGVDADSDLVHTVRGTPGNANDVTEPSALLLREETLGFGDAGDQEVDKLADARSSVRWNIVMRSGKCRALDKSQESNHLIDELEMINACISAKVGHPFHVIKRQFGHVKVFATASWRRTRAAAHLGMARVGQVAGMSAPAMREIY